MADLSPPARERAPMPGLLPRVAPGPVPGTVPRKRLRPRIDFELIACGLHGHEFAGLDAAEVRVEDATLVRETDGIRWHRCLRCDSWVPFELPATPAVPRPPDVAEVKVPLRGRPLRDRYVLRLIVLDRILHSIVLGALGFLIFLFASHRNHLHSDYTKILNVLQAGSGSWFVHELNKVFAMSATKLYVLGLLAFGYTALLLIECFGLWGAKRWAEYLTIVETGLLIPYEIYELVGSVTVFKVGAFIVNVAIVLYLAIAHRLFGLRGGHKAAMAVLGGEG
jgi:uncharacterized membrane protein (DUF2068 family)